MIIAALNESGRDDRVAITPMAVTLYKKMGMEVICESQAGVAAGFTDEAYIKAGAKITADKQWILNKINILVFINKPIWKELSNIPEKVLIIGPFDKNLDNQVLDFITNKKISVFSMQLIPRITRAQSMDSLSSQANLAGYRAVLEASVHFKRCIPMMMTAAGMIQPATVLVLGAGVAGLQAIATAKRLGAIVYAFDVRRAAKEQVESLNAEFIEVDSTEEAESISGYAKETSDEYKQLQAQLIDQFAKKADIVISTALIPGKKAPLLILASTITKMKPGSVIVDLASGQGGNCEFSEENKIIKHGEITIIGFNNLPALIPTTASELYANNLVNLIRLLINDKGVLVFNQQDEIIKAGMLYYFGQHSALQNN